MATFSYLGAAAIFQSGDEPMIYPDLMMRLRATQSNMTELLWRYFNSPQCRAWFRSQATGTAGNMPKINGQVLKATAVPVPPEAEIMALLYLLAETMAAADNVDERTNAMMSAHATLNQSILAKAFRGELVPQDPNDEPASVLLERIRAERAATQTKRTSPRSNNRKGKQSRPKKETVV